MSAVYVVLILACFGMEMSWKINTDSILEKLGVGLIALGSMVHLSGHENSMITIGSAFYFASVSFKGCISRRNRRNSDRIFR